MPDQESSAPSEPCRDPNHRAFPIRFPYAEAKVIHAWLISEVGADRVSRRLHKTQAGWEVIHLPRVRPPRRRFRRCERPSSPLRVEAEAGAGASLCRPSLRPPRNVRRAGRGATSRGQGPWPRGPAALLSRADQVIEEMWRVVSRYFLPAKASLIFSPLNLAPSTTVWPTPVNISLNPGPT